MDYRASIVAGFIAVLIMSPAYAASERGKRCFDGLDNDQDGWVDASDPNCGGEGGAALESRISSLEALVADHEQRLVVLESPQTETFDSAASAAANGWTLLNGVGNWGWQDSNLAGGQAGEARADSYIAGSKRWYADLALGEVITFNQDFFASGKMDFPADSASDGGMFFGFFDRNGSFADQTQELAGFLLVNGKLSVRFERRPDVGYIDSTFFDLWVNDDRTFTLEYDADGGSAGYGLLTGTIMASDGSSVTQSIEIPLDSISGAELNSFGFYATDVFEGRDTPFDWVVDDLSYGNR